MPNYEFQLAKDYLRRLKNKEEEIKEYTVSCALPEQEYLVNVGFVKAIREVRREFEDLLKEYFPNT